MSPKLIRLVAALAVILSIAVNTGVVSAAQGIQPSGSSQALDVSTPSLVAAQPPPLASALLPLNSPALSISPASSLGVQFVHIATVANTIGDLTIIDHPLTNGHPDAIILVTPDWNPGGVGGMADDHPISIAYNAGQWGIFNQDGANMPPNAAFNVIIPTAGANVFVHTAAAVSGDHTFINNSLANSHPNAIILVTPNRDPGGVCPCVPTNFPISMKYDTSIHRWAIIDQSGGTMPLNASFNVLVLTARTGVFVQTATTVNMGGGATLIDNPLTNDHPNAIVFVTPNNNPGGVCGCVTDAESIAVYYDGSQWGIINQGPTDVPLSASFNVLVLVPKSDIFVHKTTVDNGGNVAPYTIIDNALTNGHPNAVIFTTPNLNPGGGSGKYHNQNIGMYYNGSQWAILNQDSTHIPIGASFNVLVPNPDASVFVHTATAGNSAADYTTIDYPLANGNPNAIILVTLNWKPGGVCGCVYNNHPIGVEYTGGMWRIYNQDGAAIPVGAAFNVFVPTAAPGVDVFVHTATGVNSGANFTTIDDHLANGNPNAIILVTPNFDPGNACACVNVNFPIGVGYVGDAGIGRWAIINQNGSSSSIPLNATFNVYIVGNYKLYLPLIKR